LISFIHLKLTTDSVDDFWD